MSVTANTTATLNQWYSARQTYRCLSQIDHSCQSVMVNLLVTQHMQRQRPDLRTTTQHQQSWLNQSSRQTHNRIQLVTTLTACTDKQRTKLDEHTITANRKTNGCETYALILPAAMCGNRQQQSRQQPNDETQQVASTALAHLRTVHAKPMNDTCEHTAMPTTTIGT